MLKTMSSAIRTVALLQQSLLGLEPELDYSPESEADSRLLLGLLLLDLSEENELDSHSILIAPMDYSKFSAFSLIIESLLIFFCCSRIF